MITKTRVSVLAMVTLAVLSVVYIVNVGLHVKPLKSHTATIVVPDTNGILVGARVLLRGIEIGHVTGIEQEIDGVHVTWDYRESDRIPVDSRFRIDNLSALGEAYVAVLPDTAAGPFIADGAMVDPRKVSVPSTFQDLSERLTQLLRQVDPDEVKRVFTELDTGLPDGVEVIGDLNRAGRLLAAEFTRDSDAIVTVLATMQPLLMRSGRIPALMAEAAPRLPAFGTGFEELLASVRDAVVIGPLLPGIRDGASPLFKQLQHFLDVNSADLSVIGVNLLPAARAGSAALRTVDTGRLLNQFLAATTPRGAVTVRLPGGGR